MYGNFSASLDHHVYPKDKPQHIMYGNVWVLLLYVTSIL